MDVPYPPPTLLRPTIATPVVVSIPHAGRDYSPELLARSRLGPARLARLEDRRMDAFGEAAATAGATVLIARTPRALVDLNRGPREIDPAMFAPAPPADEVLMSAKVRGGLGIVPRRIGMDEIWRERLPAAELDARIVAVHRPWHMTLATLLDEVLRVHGAAVLLDLHSMPPLARIDPARVVVGDRHGGSAAGGVTAPLLATAAAHGLRVAYNDPYAGGYGIDRHGRPRNGIHAVQLELCRSLYLDDAHAELGPGVASTRALVAALVAAAANAITPTAIAAE